MGKEDAALALALKNEKLVNEIKSLNSALTVTVGTKVTKGEISVTDIDKNKGKLDQTYMTEEFLQQIAGTTPINAVPANNTITPLKTTFISVRNNRVIPNANWKYGYYASYANGVMYENALANYSITDFHPAVSATEYKYGNANILLAKTPYNVIFFNSSKIPIGSTANNLGTSTFTTIANTAFIKLSVRHSSEATSGLIYLDKSVDSVGLIKDSQFIQDDFFPPTSSNLFVGSTKNYFNQYDFSLLKGINATIYGNVVDDLSVYLVDVASGGVSGFISVKPNQTLYLYNIGNGTVGTGDYYLFDNNNKCVGRKEVQVLTVPENIYSIILFVPNDGTYTGIYLTESSSLPDIHIPYRNSIVKNNLTQLMTPWYNKKISAYGDSITDNGTKKVTGNWYREVVNNLGVGSIHNVGLAGRQVSGTLGGCQDDAIALIPTDSDCVITMFGTNDWAQNKEISNIDSVDTNTFCGAYNVMIQKHLTIFPSKRLIYITSPWGVLSPSHPNFTTYADGIKNNKGYTLSDYANAVKAICAKYCMPFVDMYSLCGWNQYNYTDFIPDGIHPYGIGGKRFGNVLAGELSRISL